MSMTPGHRINEGYLRHYDLLKEIGLWDRLIELETDIHNLERFFSEALEMMNIHSVPGLIEYVISCFLEKFIPEHLLFIIEEPGSALPRTHYFRGLKPEDFDVAMPWYGELKAAVSAAAGPDGGSESASVFHEFPAEMIIPMKGIGGIYGLVLFGRKIVEKSYTSRETAYINRLMRFFSVCLQNSLHHHSSITDFKTGLYNHAYFMRRLEEELHRSRRHGTGLALVLIDIDHFKLLNDANGHLAGDMVLAEVARVIKALVRAEDVLARFGGEEFTLLVPDSTNGTLEEIAERLRSTVEETKTFYDEKVLRVTISLGCVLSAPEETPTAHELLEQADAALYRSKAGGRNRATIRRRGPRENPRFSP